MQISLYMTTTVQSALSRNLSSIHSCPITLLSSLKTLSGPAAWGSTSKLISLAHRPFLTSLPRQTHFLQSLGHSLPSAQASAPCISVHIDCGSSTSFTINKQICPLEAVLPHQGLLLMCLTPRGRTFFWTYFNSVWHCLMSFAEAIVF